MTFFYRQEIKFRHCDPAGIVFYPRLFEMMNDTVEAFFERELEFPFATVHAEDAVPTARIEAEFQAPSRLGEVLDIALDVTRLGRSSLDLRYAARCGEQLRFTGSSTIVYIDSAGKSQPWPDAIRHRLSGHLEGEPRYGT